MYSEHVISTTTIYEDNQFIVPLESNSIVPPGMRIRYTNTKCHYIKDRFDSGEVIVNALIYMKNDGWLFY